MLLDVARLRADTPGCEELTHLNNAGASLPPSVVVDRVVEHLRLEASLGGYEAAAQVAGELRGVRDALATLVGASPSEIALTPSDTAAWTKALWGLVGGGWFDRGGRVLVDRAAYNSHYLSLLQLRDRAGISVEVIGAREDGSIDLADLDRRLDRDVRMVTATHVGTHRGLVNPVAEVGRRTRATGVPYFLDACQSTGQVPVDVTAIGCDVATGTGRKFLRGPRGTGYLYVRDEWIERLSPPGIDGVSAEWVDADRYRLAPDARRFEEFEHSVATALGLGAAVHYALACGVDAIAARIRELAESLRADLADAGAAVHDGGTERSGIVTFTVPGGPSPYELRARLAAQRVNISVSEAPWARLDMASRGLDAVARASVHAYNTEAEIARVVEVVRTARRDS
jgi:selenocysteine lyase/cysteine desulfurase